MKFRSTYPVGLILLIGLSAFGQAIVGFSSNLSDQGGVYSGSASIQVSPYIRNVLINAPYSGETVTENSQTLADGTHINRPMGRQEKTWRDSQGRVRMERPMFGRAPDADGPAPIVEISDPVAGYIYVLDNVNKVAHRVKVAPQSDHRPAALRPTLPPAAGATGEPGSAPSFIMSTMEAPVSGGGGGGGGAVSGGVAAPRANRPRPDVTVEDLGSKTIDGVLVYGTRRTTIIPEGEQGNDRPMTTTNETWRSKELQLTVLATNYNPASGRHTMRIANLSASEPDPALFMVPADYSLVDEDRNFTITWGKQ